MASTISESSTAENGGIGRRLKDEARAYLTISLYLWACFAALLLYEDSLVSAGGVTFVPLSTALVKALVLGKFLLIGKAMKVGARIRPRVLLHRIAWRSLALLVPLVVFTGLEELVVGSVHGRAVSDIAREFLARSWMQNVAPCAVMLLVLIPLVSFEEIDRVLGEGNLKRMLFERTDAA